MVLLIYVLRFSLCRALADSSSRHTINFLLAPPLPGSLACVMCRWWGSDGMLGLFTGSVVSGSMDPFSHLRLAHVVHRPCSRGSGQLADGSIRSAPILTVKPA
jgi:hypothetical protein